MPNKYIFSPCITYRGCSVLHLFAASNILRAAFMKQFIINEQHLPGMEGERFIERGIKRE